MQLGMEIMVEIWVRVAQAADTRGASSTWNIPSHQITLGCDHNPLSPSWNEKTFVFGGICLTEMSDAGLLVGRFSSILLPNADDASTAPIPGQIARQHLRVRPAEVDQDPEAVDGCLVCSYCSPGYT